jgi:hypothetical protein
VKSNSTLKATLVRAQEEVQDLLLDLQAGTLDRIALETGLKEVQARLKAMDTHVYRPDGDDDGGPESGPRSSPR